MDRAAAELSDVVCPSPPPCHFLTVLVYVFVNRRAKVRPKPTVVPGKRFRRLSFWKSDSSSTPTSLGGQRADRFFWSGGMNEDDEQYF